MSKVRCAVLGYDTIKKYSLSPKLQNSFLKQTKIKGKYIAIGTDNLQKTITKLNKKRYVGVNLTIPYKVDVLPLLDNIDPIAKKIGAVNTVAFREGKLYGYNTDAFGFFNYLKLRCSIAKIKKVLIIGAGGASRAVVYALTSNKITDVTIVNRTYAKALALAKEFKCSAIVFEDLNKNINKYDLIVNCTPLGLENTQPITVTFEKCKSTAVVYDLVYKPLMTPFLQNAKKHKLTTIDGLGMLAYQAAKAFEI
jgi:shikimate dehydrogenase